jgi:phage-related baseplate assembly protein
VRGLTPLAEFVQLDSWEANVPRRNRRAPSSPSKPIRVLTEAHRRELQHFAREHLAAHADMVATAEPDELATTFSEHPRTGTRFMSAGDCPDRLALLLADAAYSSDATVKLG